MSCDGRGKRADCDDPAAVVQLRRDGERIGERPRSPALPQARPVRRRAAAGGRKPAVRVPHHPARLGAARPAAPALGGRVRRPRRRGGAHRAGRRRRRPLAARRRARLRRQDRRADGHRPPGRGTRLPAAPAPDRERRAGRRHRRIATPVHPRLGGPAGRAARGLAPVAAGAPAQRISGCQAPLPRHLLLVAGGVRAHRLSRTAARSTTGRTESWGRREGTMTAPGKIISGTELADIPSAEVDYVVVGSGPGGSTAAAVLAAAGAHVAVLEEGGHYTRRDFNMQESWAYPALYQEHGNRATEDLSIMILQGRSVGGGTTVNWTSSFRTPERTLALWAARHGVRGLDAATLAPHFEAAEKRIDVGTGDPADVNANNRKLHDGAAKLGWEPELIHRSVKGCARLGYCGMGDRKSVV